jgi:hypothetical protein
MRTPYGIIACLAYLGRQVQPGLLTGRYAPQEALFIVASVLIF